ncbi:MAG: HAD-IIB family hydrolase [bacterium]|nr:HAD-IIB family hydrolase [bacterium]
MEEKASNGIKTYKHVFFDMDGTLTRSRSLIEPEMKQDLISLVESGRDVIVVSGADVPQMKKQITEELFSSGIYAMSQNGNSAFDKNGTVLWQNVLSAEDKSEINKHINTIRLNLKNLFEGADENDLIQNRGCQISLSFIGHHAELERKEKFDPDSSRRKEVLKQFPLVSNRVEVRIGGTTCLDYFEKGRNKGWNVGQIIKRMDWKPEDCVYVGDALFEGGNDETVKGIMETYAVNSPEDTASFIKDQMAQSRP